MNKHTTSELYQWQALPLNVKVLMTKQRIRDWVNYFSASGVYLSFSGGKDSTVLLHIAREMYPNLKAVFVDTGLEYPEIRQFVKRFENVDIVKPKIGFKKVVEKYGFPIISKEVSEKVYYAKKYLDWWVGQNILGKPNGGGIPSPYGIADLLGRHRRSGEYWENLKKGIIPDELLKEIFGMDSDAPAKCKMLFGEYRHKEKGTKTDESSRMFDFSKYKYLATAPFYLSHHCCGVMKKAPIKKYAKETGRVPITAQMASESRLRTNNWLKNGCNAFELNNPISNPMSFWTEQDVLLYIKANNIEISSVYGDVVLDYHGMNLCDGQLSFNDIAGMEEFDLERPLLKTTGCSRTGCIFCGFGCHLEKESRFERLKQTHPKHYKAMANIKNNGINYFEAIDWINEHNGKGKIISY